MVAQQAGPGQPSRRPPGLPLATLLTVSDETDEHDRLLLEDAAPAPAIRKAVRGGVAMETARCPYRDTPSRLGGRMNTSAYEALRRDTGAVLDGIAWLAERCYEREPDARGTVQGLADVSKIGITLPLVAFHRAAAPVRRHGALPSFVASIFKACRGMFSAAFAMRHDVGSGPTTAPDVVAYADAHGHLARPGGDTVCAAPTRLIERTIAVMLTAEGAHPEASGLGDVVSFDALWNIFRIEQAFNANLARYGAVLDELTRAGHRTDDPALFDVPVRAAGQEGTFGAFTDAFLSYANNAQALLNRALGRAENAPPLTYGDVLRAL